MWKLATDNSKLNRLSLTNLWPLVYDSLVYYECGNQVTNVNDKGTTERALGF